MAAAAATALGSASRQESTKPKIIIMKRMTIEDDGKKWEFIQIMRASWLGLLRCQWVSFALI